MQTFCETMSFIAAKINYWKESLETSDVARPVQLGRDRSGYVRLPNWSEHDQSF